MRLAQFRHEAEFLCNAWAPKLGRTLALKGQSAVWDAAKEVLARKIESDFAALQFPGGEETSDEVVIRQHIENLFVIYRKVLSVECVRMKAGFPPSNLPMFAEATTKLLLWHLIIKVVHDQQGGPPVYSS